MSAYKILSYHLPRRKNKKVLWPLTQAWGGVVLLMLIRRPTASGSLSWRLTLRPGREQKVASCGAQTKAPLDCWKAEPSSPPESSYQTVSQQYYFFQLSQPKNRSVDVEFLLGSEVTPNQQELSPSCGGIIPPPAENWPHLSRNRRGEITLNQKSKVP